METYPIKGFSDPISSITHLSAAVFFFFSYWKLFKRAKGNKVRQVSIFIYTFCLVFLFSMSGVYHLLDPSHTPRYVFRHLDYAGIWLLIAGTFVPIHSILFKDFKRWGILSLIWMITITGITLQMVFFDTIPEWLSLLFFLSLGWIGLLSFYLIKKIHHSVQIKYFILGGAFYTIGAVFEFLRYPNLIKGIIGPHEIFHFFVVLGAYYHWKFIFSFANNPISKELKVFLKHYPEDKVYKIQGLNENLILTIENKEDCRPAIKKWIEGNYLDSLRPYQIRIESCTIEEI